MKKNILKIILILILLLITPFCFCKTKRIIHKTYSTQEELKKIADEVQQCIDTNYRTDLDMQKCTDEGTRRYNIEIEKTVKAAKNILSKEQYEQFLKTQQKWEEFIKEEEKLLDETYGVDPYRQDTFLIASHDIYLYTKSRAEDLSDFCGLFILLFKE